ncbi:MAG: hypothetical protein ACJ8HI_04385, partial [Massilia sp.]
MIAHKFAQAQSLPDEQGRLPGLRKINNSFDSSAHASMNLCNDNATPAEEHHACGIEDFVVGRLDPGAPALSAP